MGTPPKSKTVIEGIGGRLDLSRRGNERAGGGKDTERLDMLHEVCGKEKNKQYTISIPFVRLGDSSTLNRQGECPTHPKAHKHTHTYTQTRRTNGREREMEREKTERGERRVEMGAILVEMIGEEEKTRTRNLSLSLFLSFLTIHWKVKHNLREFYKLLHGHRFL